jgi:adenosine kinase
MTQTTSTAAPRIAISGSLAYDHIMDFPGNFKDHILPDKMHVINLSFLVGELRKQRGGCAANIAYTLALLDTPSAIIATAGGDFDSYRHWLDGHGVDTSRIRAYDDEITASCFITTDRANNQITGFFPGAMRRARELSLKELLPHGADVLIISPDDPEAMVRHCREAREIGLRFVFDPSFQVIAMDGPTLEAATRGAAALVLNDYELAVFQEKTGRTGAAMFELTSMVIVTYGERGSEILTADAEPIKVPAATVSAVVDPTGAGDAFRAGFLAGLVRGCDLATCGRLGSLAGAYAVERYGTQAHSYDRAAFAARYQEAFGDAAPDL